MLIKCSVFIYSIAIIFGLDGLPLGKKPLNPNIIFPEEIKAEFVPNCPHNTTFCEDVTNYPQDTFYHVLKNSTFEEEYFNSQISTPDRSVSDRFHPDREYYICISKIRIQYPRVARNTRNEWKFVYNFDTYKQGVTTEECVNESTCTSFQGTPRGVRTKCTQKYSDILLLVADQDGKPTWDLFWFPSACVCSYEPRINFNSI